MKIKLLIGSQLRSWRSMPIILLGGPLALGSGRFLMRRVEEVQGGLHKKSATRFFKSLR
jgi:hypothetical protein